MAKLWVDVVVFFEATAETKLSINVLSRGRSKIPAIADTTERRKKKTSHPNSSVPSWYGTCMKYAIHPLYRAKSAAILLEFFFVQCDDNLAIERLWNISHCTMYRYCNKCINLICNPRRDFTNWLLLLLMLLRLYQKQLLLFCVLVLLLLFLWLYIRDIISMLILYMFSCFIFLFSLFLFCFVSNSIFNTNTYVNSWFWHSHWFFQWCTMIARFFSSLSLSIVALYTSK